MSDAFKEFEVAGWREPVRADAYDAVVGRVTARVAEPLLDAVGITAGTSLLDVATATGHVAGAASARGVRAVGVDVSEEMLARARRLYPGVEFALGDAEELAFVDDTFDAAVAAFLLHHVPSPERVVAELARVASRVAVTQWDAGAADRPAKRRDRGSRSRADDRPTGRPLTGAARAQRGAAPPARKRGTGRHPHRHGRLRRADARQRRAMEGVLDGSVNTRAIVLAQPPDVRKRIRDELERLIEPHRHDGKSTCPFPCASRRVGVASRRRGVDAARRERSEDEPFGGSTAGRNSADLSRRHT